MKTFTRNPVTTFGLFACLCTVSMGGSEAVAENGALHLRRVDTPAPAARTQSVANRRFGETQQYDSRSNVTPAHYGHHGQPVQHQTYHLVVHPGHHEAVTVYLHASTPYAITAQHNPGSVYRPTYPPPRDDVQLRVLRFWNGHLKMDRHSTGLGSASMSIQSTHYGVRPYVIKVCNHSSYAQRFLLTVSAQQFVQPLPQPIVQPLPRPRPIVQPLPRPIVRPQPRPNYRPLPVPIKRPSPPKRIPIVQPRPVPTPPQLNPPSKGIVRGPVRRPSPPKFKLPKVDVGVTLPGISIGIN